MKNLIKNILLKFEFTKKVLFFYRKVKLLIFSYLKLPKSVRIPLNEEFIFFNTRDFATANVCRYYLKKDGILDYEPNQRKVFIFISKFSENIFDLGTQIGFYAIIAAKLGADKVYAFDIDKSFLKIAQKHARNNKVNDKIEFVQAAIGESNNEIIEVENFSGKSKLRSISLDYFCKQNNIWPDFVKIDIEGWELETFRGAKEILKKGPIILFSLHSPFILERNKKPEEVFEILFNNNYKIFDLTENFGKEVNNSNFNDYLKNITDFLAVYQNHPRLGEIINFLKQ